ncbi:hypothetical protein VTP01DRAFT_1669 [Rhizomucor pusillus]|uniref:uncharacterized protein n=1 Tax=Rhizomucor pusillus TaxID=4840 RepID=UPI003742770E
MASYVDELGSIRRNKRMHKTIREHLRLYGRFKPETLGLAAFPISNSIPHVQFEGSASRVEDTVMTEVAVEECGPEMEVDQEKSEPSIMQASNVPFDDIDNAFGAEEKSEDSAEEYLDEEFCLANDDDYLRGETSIAIEEREQCWINSELLYVDSLLFAIRLMFFCFSVLLLAFFFIGEPVIVWLLLSPTAMAPMAKPFTITPEVPAGEDIFGALENQLAMKDYTPECIDSQYKLPDSSEILLYFCFIRLNLESSGPCQLQKFAKLHSEAL